MIEVLPLYEIESGESMGFYAKGDHTPEDFASAVNYEYHGQEDIFDPSDVRQTHARVVPLPAGRQVDFRVLYNQKPGRGAFLVTYVNYE